MDIDESSTNTVNVKNREKESKKEKDEMLKEEKSDENTNSELNNGNENNLNLLKIPFVSNTIGIQFLNSQTFKYQSLKNKTEFKKIICYCLMEVIEYPQNVCLLLNINDIALPSHRNIMFQKFQKLDSTINLVLTTPPINENTFLTKWKNNTYAEIVAHYTGYQCISNNTDEIPKYQKSVTLGFSFHNLFYFFCFLLFFFGGGCTF